MGGRRTHTGQAGLRFARRADTLTAAPPGTTAPIPDRRVGSTLATPPAPACKAPEHHAGRAASRRIGACPRHAASGLSASRRVGAVRVAPRNRAPCRQRHGALLPHAHGAGACVPRDKAWPAPPDPPHASASPGFRLCPDLFRQACPRTVPSPRIRARGKHGPASKARHQERGRGACLHRTHAGSPDAPFGIRPISARPEDFGAIGGGSIPTAEHAWYTSPSSGGAARPQPLHTT